MSISQFSVLKREFPMSIVGLTLPGLPDPSIAVAATRAGGIGVLDLEFVVDEEDALKSLNELGSLAKKSFGVKLNYGNVKFTKRLIEKLPENTEVAIIAQWGSDNLPEEVRTLRVKGLYVVVEATSAEQAFQAEKCGADAVLAKGNEAGGFVGEKTSYILLQQILKQVSLPVWVQGGIGLHAAAACYAAGAKAIVMDFQLAFTKESPLPTAVRKRIQKMDGAETTCVIGKNFSFRAYRQPGVSLEEDSLFDSFKDRDQNEISALHGAVSKRIAWDRTSGSLWPLGQDASIAVSLASYGTVASIFGAVKRSVWNHVNAFIEDPVLTRNSPLARFHGTDYPIVQGPMANISDKSAFIERVADEGALPFLALSKMSDHKVSNLVKEVHNRMGDRPWGVGLLGFEKDLFDSQLSALNEVRPPRFAIVAGATPIQISRIESMGITAYAHVPSIPIMEMFIEAGARRFIFEGNECGGHIGPKSSFVLWEGMVQGLLEKFRKGLKAEGFCVLFAGGIHDSLSASMVSIMAAPLVSMGVKVGVVMGTAYLLTKEIIETGALSGIYQENILRCTETRVFEFSPGHALRCCDTPFVGDFLKEQSRLRNDKVESDKVCSSLKMLITGRLRIASKGLDRNPLYKSNSNEPYLVDVDPERQRKEGLYMVGQVAALHKKSISIRELHRDVSVGSGERRSLIEPVGTVIAPKHTVGIDVAIVGMASVFPKANDARTYWQNILKKVNAISDIPPGRWDWQLYFDEDAKAKDKIYSRWGGFLDDMPFEPLKYGIPPGSLRSIEPLHLMTLEVVDAAIKDAGLDNQQDLKERTSVIIGTGAGIGDLGQRYIVRASLPMLFEIHSDEIMRRLEDWTEDSFPGILMNVLAGRVANRFDMGGVNYTIDAACASSLAAVYNAVRELETGGSDVVITGGVDAGQSPFTYTCFSETNALSPSGRCRVFDEKADGTVISEGLAVLVLKRLADAERDGDRIYAVIKAVAGSSDGRGLSLTAPRPEGQLRALKRAYEKAGFSPSTVGLFEAHGTGTVVGDRVEAGTLARLLEESGARRQSCGIGSVKSMVGHTKGAAGIAGLMKAALSLYHKVLPPTLGVEMPNSKIDFKGGPLYVNTEVRPWVSVDGGPRRAGVSAFGFGGTNYHAVIEEYCDDLSDDEKPAPMDEWPTELLVWSGDSPEEIVVSAGLVRKALKEGARPRLGDIAHTLTKSLAESDKGKDRYRLAVVATSAEDLVEKLTFAINAIGKHGGENLSDNRGIYFSDSETVVRGKTAFLFPGQGSQYPGMLREQTVLFPELRGSLELASSIVSRGKPQTLAECMLPSEAFTVEQEEEYRQRLSHTDIAQPAIGAASSGMLKLLLEMGVQPDMTAGHSYGEYVALYAAGVFDEKSLYTLSEARGRIIIEAVAERDLGGMAAVRADAATLKPLIDGLDDIVIANMNSPVQTVISGGKDAIRNAVEFLGSKGINARLIPVSAAFHSPLVAPARERFADYLKTIRFSPPLLEVFSNTYARPHSKSTEELVAALSEHMIRPVEFVREIEAMYEEGARIFVEVGPGNVLTNLLNQILEGRDFTAVSTDGKASGLNQFLKAVGQLFVNRVPVSLEVLYRGRGLKHLDIEELNDGAKVYPPMTWLVNGSRIVEANRPWKERFESTRKEAYMLRERRRAQRREDSRDKEPRTEAEPSTLEGKTGDKPEAIRSIEMNKDIPQVDGTGIDGVMARHQRLMNRFLETQREIMTAYFNNTLHSGEDYSPLPVQSHQRWTTGAGRGDGPDEKTDEKDVVVERNERSAAEVLLSVANVSCEASQKQSAEPESVEDRLKRVLLGITSDRTGYPEEMLNLDSDVEADLGIDSIKRVEIIGSFLKGLDVHEQERLQSLTDSLSKMKTLGEIVKKAAEAIAGSALEQTKTEREMTQKSTVSEGPAASVSPLNGAQIPRFILEPVSIPLAEDGLRVPEGGVFVITDDEHGLSVAIAEEIRKSGGDAVILRASGTGGAEGRITRVDLTDAASVNGALQDIWKRKKPVVGLIHLLPLRSSARIEDMNLETWRNRLRTETKSLFLLAQGLSRDLREAGAKGGGWLMAATAMGGEDEGDASVGQSGISGFVKTLAMEWPEVKCRVVHLDSALPVPVLSGQVLGEMAAKSGPVEVVHNSFGRITYKTRRVSLNGNGRHQLRIEKDWVILVTGGAVGITAEVANHTAEKYRPTLLLVGRSAFPQSDEPPDTAGLDSPGEIRKALVDRLRAAGKNPTPGMVENEYASLIKAREIRRNVDYMRRAGADVHYFQADVRDEKGFGELIDEIYMKFGRIDGVIHGAGVIEDKLIENKTSESFDRVFDTKADSAFILSRKLRPESLQFIAFFTSVAGCFGNPGQADYAAANEVVNGLALALDRRWGGRVMAINWGPWKKLGMVTPEVERKFNERGIQLIPPPEGACMFDEEIRLSQREDVKIVIGDGPWRT